MGVGWVPTYLATKLEPIPVTQVAEQKPGFLDRPLRGVGQAVMRAHTDSQHSHAVPGSDVHCLTSPRIAGDPRE